MQLLLVTMRDVETVGGVANAKHRRVVQTMQTMQTMQITPSASRHTRMHTHRLHYPAQ